MSNKIWIIVDNKKDTKMNNNDFSKLMNSHNIQVGFFAIDKLIPSNSTIQKTNLGDGYQKHFSQLMFPIIGRKYDNITLSNKLGPSYLTNSEVKPISASDTIERGERHKHTYKEFKKKLEKVLGKDIISMNIQDYLILFNFIFCTKFGFLQPYLTKVSKSPNTIYLTGAINGEKTFYYKRLITDDENGIFSKENRKAINQCFDVLIMGSGELVEKLNRRKVENK